VLKVKFNSIHFSYSLADGRGISAASTIYIALFLFAPRGL